METFTVTVVLAWGTLTVREGITNEGVFAAMDFAYANNSQFLAVW